jgi:hypothetical protein
MQGIEFTNTYGLQRFQESLDEILQKSLDEILQKYQILNQLIKARYICKKNLIVVKVWTEYSEWK